MAAARLERKATWQSKAKRRRVATILKVHLSIIVASFQPFPPTFFRNAGNAVLHPLLAVADDRAQNGHVQIFRSGHFRRHWAQRHHHGHGVLYDAEGMLEQNSNNTPTIFQGESSYILVYYT